MLSRSRNSHIPEENSVLTRAVVALGCNRPFWLMFYFSISHHVMFSRQFAFCLFIKYIHTYARGCTSKGQLLRGTVLWGTIKWSEKGRQNIQAKKVYSPALAYFLRLASRSFVMIQIVHSTLNLRLFVVCRV